MKFPYLTKKSLGQNFLIDKNIINKIIKIGDIDSKKNIIEIGPGYGSLTNSIINFNPNSLIAVEKDQKLFEILNNKFKDHPNIKIIFMKEPRMLTFVKKVHAVNGTCLHTFSCVNDSIFSCWCTSCSGYVRLVTFGPSVLG